MAKITGFSWLVLLGFAAVACVSEGDKEVDTRVSGGDTLCERFCDQVAKAGCVYDEECVDVCNASAQDAACGTEAQGWFECASKAPIACGADNFPSPGGCVAATNAYTTCYDNDTQNINWDSCAESYETQAECGSCCLVWGVDELEPLLPYYEAAADCMCSKCATACGVVCETNDLANVTEECDVCVFQQGCAAPGLTACGKDASCKPVVDCYQSRCEPWTK